MSGEFQTEAAGRLALRKRFPASSWALLFGVSERTGSRPGRTADAIAMSLWPSRGLQILGFEVKVSRSDWLRELKTPQKADAIAKFCDHWYVVAGSDKIVDLEELPLTWGLMVPSASGLRTARKAQLLEAEPVDRKFLASLLRRAHANLEGHVPPEEVTAIRQQAHDNALAILESEHEIGMKRVLEDVEKARDEARALRAVLEGPLRAMTPAHLLRLTRLHNLLASDGSYNAIERIVTNGLAAARTIARISPQITQHFEEASGILGELRPTLTAANESDGILRPDPS